MGRRGGMEAGELYRPATANADRARQTARKQRRQACAVRSILAAQYGHALDSVELTGSSHSNPSNFWEYTFTPR
jgi:hypothetical protein